MVRVSGQRSETPSIKTILLDEPSQCDPGQFVMVWVPGVDEFPMSLSYIGASSGITYDVVGKGTKALAEIPAGGSIGIRGPYGRGFSVAGQNLLVVAGGTGMACLAPFVEKALADNKSVDLVLAARSEAGLLFEERARTSGAGVHIATDDGSRGFRGLATELAREVAEKKSFDTVYACGPEQMISKLMEFAAQLGMEMQASLERLMKCGIGLCDSCAIDGRHVCRDGPVFKLGEMRALQELGRVKRDFSGRKIPI